MMGDGTEEQNLNQVGNPSARIREDEVDAAFGANGAAVDHDYEDVMEEAVDRLAFITDRVSAIRDQVQQSAEAAGAWAARQAEAAKQTASEKPVLVVSASAGAALAIGLAIGFIIGRATADEY